MQGAPNRLTVRYVDAGHYCAFFVHELEDALWWAVWLRERWGLQPWIDCERAVALEGGA